MRDLCVRRNAARTRSRSGRRPTSTRPSSDCSTSSPNCCRVSDVRFGAEPGAGPRQPRSCCRRGQPRVPHVDRPTARPARPLRRARARQRGGGAEHRPRPAGGGDHPGARRSRGRRSPRTTWPTSPISARAPAIVDRQPAPVRPRAQQLGGPAARPAHRAAADRAVQDRDPLPAGDRRGRGRRRLVRRVRPARRRGRDRDRRRGRPRHPGRGRRWGSCAA